MTTKIQTEIGCEPESDYCKGCDQIYTTDPISGVSSCMQIIIDYGSHKNEAPLHEDENGDVLRCQQCKDSEKAIREAIPRGEVKKIYFHLIQDEYARNGKLRKTKLISRFKSLIN